ncbi:hypothetical protein, partial [Nonomuraea sp. bgisy094]
MRWKLCLPDPRLRRPPLWLWADADHVGQSEVAEGSAGAGGATGAACSIGALHAGRAVGGAHHAFRWGGVNFGCRPLFPIDVDVREIPRPGASLRQLGRLERETSLADLDGPCRASLRHKIEQPREAQQDGYLDPARDPPVDVLALVTQIAHCWGRGAGA